jgi:AraC-like DNA-binding protein
MSVNISEIIRHKLMLWSQQRCAEKFIIAGPHLSKARLPTGVQLTPHKIRGKRVVVKDRRYYKNTRGLAALWPEAGLNEVHKLKLACVLTGHINYQLGNYKLRCGPGHFIFIPPGTPHSDGSQSYVDASKSTSCEILFFLLHPNALQCWISRSQPNRKRHQEGNYLVLNERVTLIFRALMEEVFAGEEGSLAIGEKLLPIFLAVLEREMRAGQIQTVPGDDVALSHEQFDANSQEADFTFRLKRYIQSNLRQPLTTDRAAREMFLSRAQFTRIVRRETGHSFNELVAASRIEEAKRLLSTSQWTASAIAAFIGFKSPNYFRTFFREHTGQTPNEFRVQSTRQRAELN